MNNSDFPIWLKQIKNQKRKNIIEFGLTIPYLIGCYKIKEISISIEQFVNEVIETDKEYCGVIQKCTRTKQYILGCDKVEFCEKYMSKCIIFKNKQNRPSLFITLNASELGDELNPILKTFKKLYKNHIDKDRFDWNNELGDWNVFSEKQVKTIKENF